MPDTKFHEHRPPAARDIFSTERLIMLSDGVFAIAITLLVLDLRLPELARRVSPDEFSLALIGVRSRLISFIISFAVIGTFWLGHHRMFRWIVRADSGLAALNLMFLFCVTVSSCARCRRGARLDTAVFPALG